MSQTKKEKKLWIAVAIVAMILALVCVASAESTSGMGATSGSCGRKLTWVLGNDGTLTISGTGTMSNYTSSSGTPWEARHNNSIN